MADPLPHDLEAERAVLAGLLLESEALPEIAPLLAPRDFYHPAHGATFAAIVAVHERREPVDIVTVAAELRHVEQLAAVGGPQWLGDLTDGFVTTAHLERHARIVREHAETRRLVERLRGIVAQACAGARRDALVDAVQHVALEAGAKHGESEPQKLADLLEGVFARMEDRAKGIPAPGIRTGFRALDDLLLPLRSGQVIVVAGRPSMGKTSLVTRVAVHAAAAGASALFFSLETKNEDLADRTACMEAIVDVARLRSTRLDQSEFNAMVGTANRLYALPLWFDDGYELTLATLRRKALRHKQRHGLGLVAVDYLGLMKPARSHDSREREVSEISRGLKALAKELDVPIVALSQLNRGPESRSVKDNRPRLADLRDSGAVEQDADAVLFVYRDIVYNPKADPTAAEVIVAKQKNGPTGTAMLRFARASTRFDDVPDERAAEGNHWSDGEEDRDAAE